jgi:hypothetical protein
MKRAIVLAGICGVLLFATLLYVVAPTLKSRVEAAWLIHPENQAHITQQPAVQTVPSAPKPSASTQMQPAATTKVQDGPEQDPPAPAVEPKTIIKTVSFMPGQAINIPNKKFRKIEIHSGYPLRIFVGPCHNNYAVEFVCNSDPSDLFIVDIRRPPIFRTPVANSVTITATEF